MPNAIRNMLVWVTLIIAGLAPISQKVSAEKAMSATIATCTPVACGT